MEPKSLAEMLQTYGGWGISVLLIGAVVWLAKALLAEKDAHRVTVQTLLQATLPLADKLADGVELLEKLSERRGTS